ncbi:MAG: hypothetical protein GX988_02050 [Clostridiales bacterium]|nr:hypothetical protein [Clostridiales bacterium]
MSEPKIMFNEIMHLGGKDMAIIYLENGEGTISKYNLGNARRIDDKRAVINSLCIEDYPIINITTFKGKGQCSDKMICSGYGREDASREITRIIEESGNTGYSSLEGAVNAIYPILSKMSEGLYGVYYTKLYPTDGAGNFFWSLSSIPREMVGSADRKCSDSPNETLLPCFLLPTISPIHYNEQKIESYREQIRNGDNFAGIALQIEGLFCALLDGHHRAAACTLEEVDFFGIVIEKIDEVLFEEVEDEDSGDIVRKATGFASISCKLPFELIPQSISRKALQLRKEKKPENYYKIKYQYNNREPVRGHVSWSDEIIEKSELLPDAQMILSAQTISGITDDELIALLASKTSHNGRIIVSRNLYESIVTAINFLLYTDGARFIEFAIAVMREVNLVATHHYIAQRLSRVNDKKIYDFFKEITDNEQTKENIKEIAVKYLERNENRYSKQDEDVKA